MSNFRRVSGRICAVLFVSSFLVLTPFLFVRAQTNIAAATDAMCVAVCTKALQEKPPKPCPTLTRVTCGTGPVTGICMIDGCKGVSYKGLNGQSSGVDSGLAQLGKALGDLIKQLSQGGGGGGGQPPPPGTQASLTSGGQDCTGSFQSAGTPCQYQMPVSGGISTDLSNLSGCDALSTALGLCGGNTDTGNTTPTTPTTPTPTPTPAPTPTPTQAPTPTPRRVIFQPTGVGGIGIPGGARGDIFTRLHDATVVAGARDEKNNVEVSGFFGSQTFGSQSSEGLVSGWCRSRPWASNFLSKIIDPAFFDGLCKARGYQVGERPPPSQPVVRVTQTKPAPKTATSTPVSPTITPKVDIWAVPASVPLGARTSIFWSTQGVESCTETSPDGSFNQGSLSGGAATVPIVTATTFTISCLAPDSSHVTAYVIVNLSI